MNLFLSQNKIRRNSLSALRNLKLPYTYAFSLKSDPYETSVTIRFAFSQNTPAPSVGVCTCTMHLYDIQEEDRVFLIGCV